MRYHFFARGYPTEIATMSVGDYGVKGFSSWDNPRFIIERKSIDDLISSLTHNRSRFWRECEKLKAFGFAALVIEATQIEVEQGRYHSGASPNSITGSLAALQVRHGLHVCFARNHTHAAEVVERLVRQFVRGLEKDHRLLIANPKAQTTTSEAEAEKRRARA